MNEIFDKLIIRFLFSAFICGMLFVYRYAHKILYPSSKKQMFRKFFPSENTPDTIHIFSRIIGICLIFSSIGFNESTGVFLSLFHFFFWSTVSFVLYLVSIYVCESIALYNFTYQDEVLKRKNMAYSVVSFSISICLALIIRKVVTESEFSILLLTMFWLFSLVIFGLCIKLFKMTSKIAFNKMMIQKSMALAFSFSGYIFGATTIILVAFNHEHLDIKRYAIQVTLTMILSFIIFPIFLYGVHKAFKLQDDLTKKIKDGTMDTAIPETGYGIYEGAIYYSSALLTSIIVGQIHFGIIYPFF